MVVRSVPAMNAWKAVKSSLDDLHFSNRKFRVALLLIALGVLGRLLFMSLGLANIETVLVASLLAGTYLGGIYVLIVPVSIMVSTDVIIYVGRFPGFYRLGDVAALALFVYTGYIFIALIGAATKRRILFRLKSIVVLTSISIPLTVVYDIWTATGMWLTISGKPPISYSLWRVYEIQVPFTLFHIASSLIFVPIFGTIFLYYLSHPAESPAGTAAPSEDAGSL